MPRLDNSNQAFSFLFVGMWWLWKISNGFPFFLCFEEMGHGGIFLGIDRCAAKKARDDYVTNGNSEQTVICGSR